MLKSLVYELQNEVKNKGQNFNFIKDYSWDNIMKTMKLYDLHWVDNRSEKIKTEDLSKLKDIISWDSQFSIIAECFLWQLFKFMGYDFRNAWTVKSHKEKNNGKT